MMMILPMNTWTLYGYFLNLINIGFIIRRISYIISLIEKLCLLIKKGLTRMFDFFKKNKEIVAPVTGKVVDLSEVPDEVFAQKLAGDGVAIVPTGNEIVSPADGTLTLLFGTGHAFAITMKNGIELLVHIGIDTVALSGKGFTKLVEQGVKVKAGTPIVRIEKEAIEAEGYSLITPVLVTNPDVVSELKGAIGIEAKAGETPIIDYTLA